MASSTTSLDVSCCACDYVLSHEHFAQGKGRIMFSAGWGITEGNHRCGRCDDRCSDPTGELPDDSDEDDKCDYCGSFDYNCDGCDDCCWCGGSGDIHQGCGCHDESSQSGLVTSETGTLGSDSEKFDEKIPLLSGIINQTTMASISTSSLDTRKNIYIANGCGKLFFFQNVPDDVEEWFDNNSIQLVTHSYLSNCDWGFLDEPKGQTITSRDVRSALLGFDVEAPPPGPATSETASMSE